MFVLGAKMRFLVKILGSMNPSHLAALALALTGFSSQALAWGADGHRAVAAIAIKLLPPDKAQAAQNLLSNSDVDRGFVDAASYADEVIRERDHRGVFSPWHFVDWPADAAAYSDSFCTPDCIVNELPKQIEAMQTVGCKKRVPLFPACYLQ